MFKVQEMGIHLTRVTNLQVVLDKVFMNEYRYKGYSVPEKHDSISNQEGILNR